MSEVDERAKVDPVQVRPLTTVEAILADPLVLSVMNLRSLFV